MKMLRSFILLGSLCHVQIVSTHLTSVTIITKRLTHPIKASLGLTYSMACPKPYGNIARLPSSTPLTLGGDWVPDPTSETNWQRKSF